MKSIRSKILLFILPVVVSVITLFGLQNYYSTKNTLLQNYYDSQKQIELTLANSIDLIDAGYRMIERLIEDDLEKKMPIFLKAYQNSNGKPENINLEQVKKDLGGELELYIIDSEAVVRYTTDKNALNFDFKKFLPVSIFDEIRNGNQYKHERIMVNVVSGFLGKWIYAPTPDKKYILEFGYSYKGLGEVVKDLDPLLITKQLTEISPLVKNIRLFGVFGNEFKDKVDENYKSTEEILARIQKVIKEQRIEITEKNGEVKTYLFVDLKKKKQGISDPSKIIEITYDFSPINNKLKQTLYSTLFFTVLLIIISTTAVFILSKKLTQPIENLEAATRKIASGEYSKPVTVETLDEIGKLAESFNKMAIEIKNSYNKLEEVTREKTKAKTEMEIARNIQLSLIPSAPNVSEFDLVAYMKTAYEVGGDYYDTIQENGREWFLIGDASGHGVPAGLVMMMVQTSIHTVIMTHPNLSPAEMLQKVNQVITANIKLFNMNKYMTITLFLKDKDGKLYFSGMHQDLVIYKANTKKVETIETRGNWIGYADIDNTFFVDQLELEKGDTLFLFTDGLTEAKKNGEFFDLNGLIQFMEVNGNKSVIDIKEQVLKELSNYEVEDDVTFMVLKRK